MYNSQFSILTSYIDYHIVLSTTLDLYQINWNLVLLIPVMGQVEVVHLTTAKVILVSTLLPSMVG